MFGYGVAWTTVLWSRAVVVSIRSRLFAYNSRAAMHSVNAGCDTVRPLSFSFHYCAWLIPGRRHTSEIFMAAVILSIEISNLHAT